MRSTRIRDAKIMMPSFSERPTLCTFPIPCYPVLSRGNAEVYRLRIISPQLCCTLRRGGSEVVGHNRSRSHYQTATAPSKLFSLLFALRSASSCRRNSNISKINSRARGSVLYSIVAAAFNALQYADMNKTVGLSLSHRSAIIALLGIM